MSFAVDLGETFWLRNGLLEEIIEIKWRLDVASRAGL